MEKKQLIRSKKKEKIFIHVFSGVFISIGILLVAACIYINVSSHIFRQEAQTVKAVITAMRGASSESLGTPVVEYIVDGTHHVATLNMASSSMYPGKQITIYYNKDHPQEVRYLDENGWLTAIFLFMGIVFAGIGTAFMAVKHRQEQKTRLLQATGDVIEAEITDIRENMNKTMNGQHPIVISCRYRTSGGRVYLFQSGSFWYASYEIDMKKKIRVYVDRNNPSNYYVDVDSVV